MEGWVIGVIIISLVGLVLILSVIGMYNGLVKRKNAVEQAFADIDVLLKKRYDLIPNLVNTVKGYAKHEKETLNAVTECRANAQKASTTNQKIKAENKFNSALRSVFAVSESYPELKADQNFLSLQESLSKMETEIATQRTFYNAEVTRFNTKIQVFPDKLVAGLLNFTKFELFQIVVEEERQNVKVEF